MGTRATTPAARREREDALVEAARRLCASRPFPDVAVADVAREAGVAKGTVFLYFPTKEALGLRLVETLLEEWLAALSEGLAGLGPHTPPSRVAAVVAASLRDHRLFRDLVALLGTVLERNVDAARVRDFKRTLLASLATPAREFERVCPALEPGGGVALFLSLHAMVVGLHALADPAPAVRESLDADDLAPLRVDFEPALARMLELHLAGLAATASP